MAPKPLKLTYTVKQNKFPQIESEIRLRAGAAVRKASFDIDRHVKVAMGGPHTGRSYPRAGGKVHIASAPGEPPAIDYGTLINSIAVEFPEEMQGVIFSSVPYSYYLEFGTPKIAPRPVWVPAAEAIWPGFVDAIDRALGSL